MESNIPAFLLTEEPRDRFSGDAGKTRFSFIERTIAGTAKSLRILYLQAESAGNSSFIARLNPVTKVLAFVYLILVISFVHSLKSQVSTSGFLAVAFLFSGLNMARVYRQILLISFLFGFLLAAPAALNVVTPGDILVSIISLGEPHDFWIYHVPARIGITLAGCNIVARIFMRVFNSVSLSFLLVYSTSFPRLLKAFRIFFIPDTLLMVFWLAYKYIFILCRTVEETYLALKSRMIRNVRNETLRGIAAGRILYLYEKSQINYEQTYAAMISRGYAGKIILAGENKMTVKDLLILLCTALLGAAILIL